MGINENMMKKIKKVLISLSDKTNLKFLLKSLSKYNIEIISSGGTYNKIKRLGFNCTEISKYTKFYSFSRYFITFHVINLKLMKLKTFNDENRRNRPTNMRINTI